MSEEAAEQRREVYYSGRVQGVGFRYTVRRLAAGFAVSGFVKNLPDGRVQLVAEGSEDELQRFLEAIDGQMGYYIGDAQRNAAPATGRFPGFDIRF